MTKDPLCQKLIYIYMMERVQYTSSEVSIAITNARGFRGIDP